MRIDLVWTRDELAALIGAERDKRIASGVDFNGVSFQTRDGDRENIAGAATLAIAAIMTGAQPGDYRWHGGPDDFAWIASNNSLVPMDAHDVIAFGTVVANRKERLYRAARLLKDGGTLPLDFTNDRHWPDIAPDQ